MLASQRSSAAVVVQLSTLCWVAEPQVSRCATCNTAMALKSSFNAQALQLCTAHGDAHHVISAMGMLCPKHVGASLSTCCAELRSDATHTKAHHACLALQCQSMRNTV